MEHLCPIFYCGRICAPRFPDMVGKSFCATLKILVRNFTRSLCGKTECDAILIETHWRRGAAKVHPNAFSAKARLWNAFYWSENFTAIRGCLNVNVVQPISGFCFVNNYRDDFAQLLHFVLCKSNLKKLTSYK